MINSENFDRDELARFTNQLLDEDLTDVCTNAAPQQFLSDWNDYLSDFYDKDESVYLLTV